LRAEGAALEAATKRARTKLIAEGRRTAGNGERLDDAGQSEVGISAH